MPTIANALQEASTRLAQCGIDDARFEAQLLLARVLGRDRAYLRAWGEQALPAEQHARFLAHIARRAEGVPIAYILGEREFWSLRLRVTPDTLIPRAETELLVEQALIRIPTDAAWRIADLGTGSGAIALAIAKECPGCSVVATDTSAAALEVARDNAARLDIGNVQFRCDGWFAALGADHYDMIVSNPPYVRANDPHLRQGDVRFEPQSALVAGEDGLSALRMIAAGAGRNLGAGGWLLLEHGYDQAEAVCALLRDNGLVEVNDYQDAGGQPRVAAGRKR